MGKRATLEVRLHLSRDPNIYGTPRVERGAQWDLGTRGVSTCPALQRLDSRGRIQNRNQVAHDIWAFKPIKGELSGGRLREIISGSTCSWRFSASDWQL